MLVSIVMAILAAYLLIVDPLLGRWSQRRMLAAATRNNSRRLHFYLHWIWQGWLLLAVTLLVTLGIAGWTPAQLGLRLPYWPHLPAFDTGTLHDFLAGAIGGVVLAIAAGIVVGLRRARSDKKPASDTPNKPAANPAVQAMLPDSRDERLAWVGLAITAGVTEEIVWRGFGLGLLFMLLPTSHAALPIALAACAFGWAHLYQGATGMLTTALFGAVLATLFWISGSLLWPIVLHVLLDLPPSWSRASRHAGQAT